MFLVNRRSLSLPSSFFPFSLIVLLLGWKTTVKTKFLVTMFTSSKVKVVYGTGEGLLLILTLSFLGEECPNKLL